MSSDENKIDYDRIFSGGGNRKLIIIAVVLVMVFYGVWQGGGITPEETAKSEKKSTPTELDIELSGKNAGKSSGVVRTDLPEVYIANKCNSFPKAEGEIGCEDAVNLSLEKYGGYAYYIEDYKLQTAGKETAIWIIYIKSETPASYGGINETGKQSSKIKISVDKKTGDMHLLSDA